MFGLVPVSACKAESGDLHIIKNKGEFLFIPSPAREVFIISQTPEKGSHVQEETFPLHVERIFPETPRVKTFRLRPELGELPFRFLPGQHMGVSPCLSGSEKRETPAKWRHFSLSSSPENRGFAEISVLNQGTASAALHHLSPGDGVEVTRPTGRFTFEDPADHGPVFFGAGIGVAPLRSMVRYCLDRDLGEAITVFLCFPSVEEGLFLKQFRAWAEETPRMDLRIHLSGSGPAGEQPPYRGGLQDPDVLREGIARPGYRTCYLCLPPGLREGVHTALVTMGVPAEQIHAEIW